MTISRRLFLGGAATVTAGPLALANVARIRTASGAVRGDRPLIVSTWPFGQRGNERAREVLLAGGSALDGVEQGIRRIESEGPDRSVGIDGRPNAAGYVQLDACIMNGADHRAGSVAGVEGIVHPITAARRVMEHSKHVMLVGEGARWFALEHGLESVDVSGHAAKKAQWVAEHQKQPDEPERRSGDGKRDGGNDDDDDQRDSHDTIALLVLAADGSLAGGCSTSGMAGKLPGRVGDSPILGSGLYVDGAVGAAGGTGTGENAMRHCASFLVVELMRQGATPADACAAALHRMAATDPLGYGLDLSLVALDSEGRWGAATTGSFSCSVTTRTESDVARVPAVEKR